MNAVAAGILLNISRQGSAAAGRGVRGRRRRRRPRSSDSVRSPRRSRPRKGPRDDARRILIAGGGTGGHVFPGLAVARRARASSPTCDVVFAGSPRGLETRVVPAARLHARAARRRADEGRGPGARGPRRARRGEGDASRDAALVRPPPAERGAQRRRLRGRARRRSRACARASRSRSSSRTARSASRTACSRRSRSAPTSRGPRPARHFRGDKARLYGVPLRPGFAPRAYARDAGAQRVLVLGGSQGAQALNERRARAPSRAPRAKRRRRSTSCTRPGADREADVRAGLRARRRRRRATVVPFLDDVAEQHGRGRPRHRARGRGHRRRDLPRSAAPSILVPFPHAADDHQAKNAMALAELGGAVCIRQEAADDARLATELALLLADDERRARMAARRARARPPARRRTTSRAICSRSRASPSAKPRRRRSR